MITIPPLAHSDPIGQQQLRGAAVKAPPKIHRTTRPIIYFLARLAVGDWQTNSHYHEVQRLAYAIIRPARAARPIYSSFVLYQRLMRGALIAAAGGEFGRQRRRNALSRGYVLQGPPEGGLAQPGACISPCVMIIPSRCEHPRVPLGHSARGVT